MAGQSHIDINNFIEKEKRKKENKKKKIFLYE